MINFIFFIGSILEIYIYFILGERKNIYLNANVIQKFFFMNILNILDQLSQRNQISTVFEKYFNRM